MSSGESDKKAGLALPLVLVTGLLAAIGAGFYFLGVTGSTSQATLPQKTHLTTAWEPERPVELVIMAGKGGGADRLGRFIQKIIESNGLSEQPFIPVNMGGDSGAEALRYMKKNAGNPHVVMITLNSIYTTPLRNPEIDVDIMELTPIARMAEDTFLLWVHADQDIQTVDDYVAAVRAAGPENWRMGGTGVGAEDSLVTAMLEQAYGIKHEYLPFKGGGTVAKNLIEGNVQATVNNPSEQLSYYQAGKSRPLASFTPERLEAFPNVPTFRELGYDMVYYMQRSVVAAPRISKAAKAYYQELFRKVHVSKEWTDYAEQKALNRAFLPDTPLLMYFADERQKHRELLAAMGEVLR